MAKRTFNWASMPDENKPLAYPHKDKRISNDRAMYSYSLEDGLRRTVRDPQMAGVFRTINK